MDTLICNKCFVPMYRGKQPYHITQCGHVFCQDCSQQAEKQCTQCETYNVISVPLKEPLAPMLSPFFVPLEETLEILRRVDVFRTNQMKITMKRFHELDKKYEMTKNQYWIARKQMIELANKLKNMKLEKERLDKKLLFAEVPRQRPFLENSFRESNTTMTPKNSSIFIRPSSSGYSSELMEIQSVDVIPMQSREVRRHYKPADGFRVPIKRKNIWVETKVQGRDTFIIMMYGQRVAFCVILLLLLKITYFHVLGKQNHLMPEQWELEDMPFLPIIFANSEYLSDGPCKEDTLIFLHDLLNGSAWAVQMFDSSTKYPEGILYGHTRHFGNFDECYNLQVNIAEGNTNIREINGKYCLVNIEYEKKHATSIHQKVSKSKYHNDTLDKRYSFWKVIK
ncbi:PREDICTED: uncharacterized protein LOC106747218, partial [Dinoponera quadriceps]|uniref:Uncharacterized protein LOC106747218 n=1 Tax=Dinoponera quadriceps TaxID=609295 RepID=A0A6P3XPB2_DINQU